MATYDMVMGRLLRINSKKHLKVDGFKRFTRGNKYERKSPTRSKEDSSRAEAFTNGVLLNLTKTHTMNPTAKNPKADKHNGGTTSQSDTPSLTP